MKGIIDKQAILLKRGDIIIVNENWLEDIIVGKVVINSENVKICGTNMGQKTVNKEYHLDEVVEVVKI